MVETEVLKRKPLNIYQVVQDMALNVGVDRKTESFNSIYIEIYAVYYPVLFRDSLVWDYRSCKLFYEREKVASVVSVSFQ